MKQIEKSDIHFGTDLDIYDVVDRVIELEFKINELIETVNSLVDNMDRK